MNATGGTIGGLALLSTLIAIISAATFIAPLIGPGLAAFLWQSFMNVVRLLPERKKVWGTIYDATTKRPIPFAKVQLIDRNRRVLETRTADSEGRYGFLTAPESLVAHQVEISLVASYPGYAFPSRVPATIDTFVYPHLYHGEQVQVNDQMLINFDIPMDPINPAKALVVSKSHSIALGATTAALADAGFWIGCIIVPINFLLVPNPFTFGTLCIFLGTASLRIFGISGHPYGAVSDASTGKPMPFALITVNDKAGTRIAFAVSDERGRYFIAVPSGQYEVTVFTPSLVNPPRRATMAMVVTKGWLTKELTV